MLEDIFARMPAKSVQRCRCLSRAWAAKLSSRRFVDRHLRRGSPRLFFLPEYFSDDTTVYAWSPSRPLVRRDDRLRQVAAVTRHCRGLVVLEAGAPTSFDSSMVDGHYVCNPSTGQITALPKGKESFTMIAWGSATTQASRSTRWTLYSLRRARSLYSIPPDTGGHRALQQISAPTRASLHRATCTGSLRRIGSSTAKGLSYPSRSCRHRPCRCTPVG